MRLLNTIWKKLLVVYLVVVIPFLALLIIDAFTEFREHAEIELNASVGDSRTKSFIFEDFIKEIFIDQQSLGLIITEIPHAEHEITDFIRPIKENHFISGMWFMDAQKKVVGGLPDRTGADFSSKEAIIAVSKKKNVLTNIDKQFKVTTASRIVRQGQTVGFLISEFKSQSFSNIFSTKQRQRGVAVVDSNGTLVFQNIQDKTPVDKNWQKFLTVQQALNGKVKQTTSFRPKGFPKLLGAISPSDNLGWAVGSFIPASKALGPITVDIIEDSIIALIIVVIALVISMLFAASIARPVKGLSENAKKLAEGQLDKEIEFKTGDEIQTLSQNLDYMRRRLKKDINEIKILQKKQEEIANTLQKSFLPAEIPKIKNLEIGVHYESATELAAVGGDFYDIVRMNNDKWAIIAGDVSGKGVEAAGNTAMIKYILRGLLFKGIPLSKVVSQLNDMVQKQTAPGHYISLVVVLYKGNGQLELINAGHPQPLLFSEGKPNFLEESSLAVGVFGKQEYKPINLRFNTDDLLVLYTDGLTEAKVGSELFAEERLSMVISENVQFTAQEIALRAASEAKNFAKGILNDDLLALVIKKVT